MADEEEKIADGSGNEDSNQDDELRNEAFDKAELNCRFYGNEFPEVDDLVMVSDIHLCF